MYNRFVNYALSVALLLTTAIKCYAQDKDIPKEYYQASTIPDSLKTEEAYSVLRYSREDMVVTGPGRAAHKVHTVVAILNEKGNDEARVVLPYNKKYNSVDAFEMRVYNADGTLLKKYHKSDLYDRSATDDETMISDERLLLLQHTIARYPATIEITYEESLKSLLNLGEWDVQGSNQAVQNAYYSLAISSDAGFRYLNRNTTLKPAKTTVNKTDTYLWQISNQKAIKPETGAVPWSVLPKVYFAANNFEFYGLPGDMSSWAAYGKWQQALNADVCSLSPQREAEIRKMTDTIKTDKEKAKFLYHYLQQNMRYVSIQLGIGGFKPFPATFVDQKKYGDCKALANYMCAMLKAVKIPAYYALVRAGVNEEPCNPAFPYDLANHIIVCVPFKADTTWLECTSNTQPFGKLGTFTENRNALLITETGGKLVNTPKSTIEDNRFDSYVHVMLTPDGGAKAQLKIVSTGGYRDEYVGLSSIKLDDQKEFMIRNLHMKQPSAFDFKDAPDKNGVKEVNIDLEYDRFFDVAAGDKQFYRPAIFDVWGLTLPEARHRKMDYYFEHPMQKTCVTTIDLPTGFEMESLPTDVKLKFSYGNYEASYHYDQAKNQVITTIKFNLNNQVIPAVKYAEMQEYMDDIAKAQNKKLVIKRKA